MFWNNVRTIVDGMEKSFEREYAKFDEYDDVEGLSEFRELVVGLRDSDILIEFDKVVHYVVDDSNFDDDSYKSFLNSNEFFERSKEKLAKSFIQVYFPSIHGLTVSDDVGALLMLIEFNYFYYSKMRCSRVRTIERVFCGDIILYLSFFTDEFKLMGDLPDYDDSFFTNLRNLKYEDKRTRIFEDFLRCGYLSLIVVEQNISWAFFNNIKFSALYLMACNALKRGSCKVSCEDVVVGYTLALKFVTEDMRQYVRMAFDNKK